MTTNQGMPFSTLTEAAVAAHEWFVSLMDAGFTEDQALKFVVLQINTAPMRGDTDG